MTHQSTQQKLPFSYEVVFNAIITVLPSIRFRLKYKNKDIGRITANTGMSLFSMGECITILVEKVDDNKTTLTIESALKFGSSIFAHHRHTKNFNRLIKALSEYLQSSGDNFVNKRTQGLKKKGRVGNILAWVLLILVFLGLAGIVKEGIVNLIGLHTIPIFSISFFFFLGSGLLLAKGIQAKKTNKKQPAKISFFIKAGFITLFLTAIFLSVTAFQTKDLSNKYEQAMVALKCEDWDKAIQLFNEIKSKSIIDKYKDTSEHLCEAKYQKAKDLLVNAMDNYSKNNFSASVGSTEKAIAVLEDCQSLNASATLLFQAKEFLKKFDSKKISKELTQPLVVTQTTEQTEQTTKFSEEVLKITEYALKMQVISRDFTKSNFALSELTSNWPYWSDQDVILIESHAVILEGIYDRARAVSAPQKLSSIHQKYLNAFKIYKDVMPIITKRIANADTVLLDKSTNMILRSASDKINRAAEIMEETNIEFNSKVNEFVKYYGLGFSGQ
ncbi:MAG: hypothetical protein K8F34_00250 [Candidatus Kuenenia stuttgartiensis]|nr:hypothetical protein [Candidatus Kuenenia stuttgartiensis]